METIVLFDPSIRSLNLGDHIIMNSSKKELSKILENRYVIECGTHTPAVTFYQNTNLNPRMKVYNSAKYKFICGSNLLWKNLFLPRPTFNINLWNSKVYKDSILLGVGTNSSKKKVNWYTKKLYKNILSKDIIHSVRDDSTKEMLEELGYKAINTGCPTMWQFDDEFCSQIPKKKATKVIFTLTDYHQDKIKDQKMIDILNKNYSEVFFWLQGIFDEEYFRTLQNIENIKIISPSLEAFEKVLVENEIDYIGTRLHAGMFALQHKKRTIILAIDNRVRDMKRTYNLNSIERDNIEELEKVLLSEWETKICINKKNIEKWLSQFEIIQK